MMADLTPELLDKLEEIAKAATPGPWTTTPPPVDRADGFSLGAKIGATRGGTIYATPPGGQYPLADAKHIAAASPDVVLALVAAVRKMDRIRDLAIEAARLAVKREWVREDVQRADAICGEIEKVLNGR